MLVQFFKAAGDLLQERMRSLLQNLVVDIVIFLQFYIIFQYLDHFILIPYMSSNHEMWFRKGACMNNKLLFYFLLFYFLPQIVEKETGLTSLRIRAEKEKELQEAEAYWSKRFAKQEQEVRIIKITYIWQPFIKIEQFRCNFKFEKKNLSVMYLMIFYSFRYEMDKIFRVLN